MNKVEAGGLPWRAITEWPIFQPRWLKAFGRHCWRHFKEDRSFESAAALTYTSLLALVPLMAVMLGVLSGFPVFERWTIELETYVFSQFVPAAGEEIQAYLHEFIERSAGLTGAGTVFLIATAIILMSTIEKSFNRIWRVKAERRLVNRLVIYWAVLTLGPLLMGGSLALTSYITALQFLAPEAYRGVAQGVLLSMTPFLVALVSFTLIFVIVPNRRVRWHHALAGGLASALLFEFAKSGFVWYVSNFPTYERLYGALATIPIFLVWIFVSWVVVLLGASLAAALTTFNFRRVAWRWSPQQELILVLRLLRHFWQAQRRGDAVSVGQLLALEPAADDHQLQRLLNWLGGARLIHRDDDGDWLLSADLGELTLGDLYRQGEFVLPLGEQLVLPEAEPGDAALINHLQQISQDTEGLMQQPIKALVRTNLESL